jgi:polysaccharide export outer membrane protein
MRSFLLALFALMLGAVLGTAAPAQTDYRINPGDVLAIEVLQDPTLNREVLVLPDGRFSFPFAGTVQARGRTTGDVEAAIAAAIAPNFASQPNVFVTVRQLRPVVAARGPAAPATIAIYFLGEVAKPGRLDVAPGTTLLQALAQGGGFTSFAATKRVQLRRTDPVSGRQTVSQINYRALADGAELTREIVLQAGDVILVPERRLFE